MSKFPSLRLPVPRAALFLVLLLPVFAWAPLTYPGYFEFHSGFLPIFNINARAAHLTDLSWIPGVGLPRDWLRGDGTLPYTAAAFLVLLGAAPAAAAKAVFGMSIVSGSLGMFAWSRQRLGPWPAVVSATVYALAPISLATVLVRGAFAEAAFLGLAPWVLAGADACLRGRRWAAGLLGGAVALALWTQAGMTLWLVASALLYVLASAGTRDREAQVAIGGLLLGALAGFLGLLPAILGHGWADPSYVAFADHFVYPHQFLNVRGSGASLPGPSDGLTFNLGFVSFGLAAFAFLLPRSAEDREERSPRRLLWVALAVAGGLLFLASSLAAPIWDLVPFLARTLTYPWQLLLVAAPWWAWLAGAGAGQVLRMVSRGNEHVEPAALAALLALVLLPVYGDLRPLTTQADIPDSPIAVYGDNEVVLLSATPDGAAGAGAEVAMDVRWQALRPLDRDYTVFFHVIGDGDGKRYGQQDTQPQAGSLPTSTWRPGQIVDDRYAALLPPDTPRDTFKIWLGLYDAASGQRLPAGADDKAVLPLPEAAQ